MVSSQDGRKGQWPPALVLGALVAFRIINALSIKTFFQPDEYFQSLEPAWQAAFGPFSGAWITWEWREQLRSSIHPLLFAAIYKTVVHMGDALHLPPQLKAEALILAPKVVQGLSAATLDFYTYRLARQIYGKRSPVPAATLAITVFSPWNYFCSARTLSNSLETTLTTFALSYWPWSFCADKNKNEPKEKAANGPEPNDQESMSESLYLSMAAAALACIMRPTNIAIWASIAVHVLVKNGDFRKAVILIETVLVCGSAALVASASMDRIFYERWTFPPLRFLYFNLVQSLAVFYGQNRPDYYLTEGLPLLLTTALPFGALGLWNVLIKLKEARTHESRITSRSLVTMASAVVVSVVALSLISHKEVRFIYPLLPMLHIIAAEPLSTFFGPFPIPPRRSRQALLLLAVGANLLIAGYTSFVHQRGVVDVMHFLRHEHEDRMQAGAEGNTTVGFLMPCHSTPWRSHLVYPGIDAWALTCEPPLDVPLQDRETYLDEADVFYANPTRWVRDNMDALEYAGGLKYQRIEGDKSRDWPRYLAFFQHLEPTIQTLVGHSSYRSCWRGFNTHWHDDWRRQGDVVVYCRD